MTPTKQPLGRLPRWLKPMNKFIILLHKLGLAPDVMRVLSVPGRKSGKLQVTPVSPFTVDGHYYVMGGTVNADWVKNARAAGWGMLAQGRKTQKVTLHELPVAERGPILHEFPRLVPTGINFMRQLHPLPDDPAALPDAFAALAERATIFRIDDLAS